MFRSRFWMLVTVPALTLAVLLGTAGYGLYVRSSLYANRVASRATAFLGTAMVQIGKVVPLDASCRSFHEVAVWLPDQLRSVFCCQQAILRTTNRTMELELCNGRLQADTDTWTPATLTNLLHAGLAHDFQQVRLATIKLVNIDLAFRRGPTMLNARGASGRIDLTGKTGRLDILCNSLNRRKAAGPIAISSPFRTRRSASDRRARASLPGTCPSRRCCRLAEPTTAGPQRNTGLPLAGFPARSSTARTTAGVWLVR